MDTLSWLHDTGLGTPVEALLDTRVDHIDDWSCDPVAGGAGETLGVWRVTGTATAGGVSTPFALILKGWAAAGTEDPTACDWPHRELRACASGDLDLLPAGIAAPRCLGEMRGLDGTIWAWMTSVSTGAITAWNLEHFALVARRLGRFNGAYLSGQPLPTADWVSRGWTRKWTEAARASIEQLDRYIGRPLVAQVFPPAERRAIERLFAERHGWFDAIDALPRTFCHLDAFPRNVFLRPGPDGGFTLSLIDWSFTGIAAVGEEIAPLVSASFILGKSGDLSFEALDQALFAAYVEGLRDAGWLGDERLVRLGYAGSLVMRYLLGPLRLLVPALVDERYHPRIELIAGMPITTFADVIASHGAWALGLADEFRHHLATMPPRLPDAA